VSTDTTPLSLGVMEAVSVHCAVHFIVVVSARAILACCDIHFLVPVDILTSHLLVAGNAYREESQ